MKFLIPIQPMHLDFGDGLVVESPSDVNECLYNALLIGKTVYPYACRLGNHRSDSRTMNVSRFHEVDGYSGILDLVNHSTLMEIVPGENRQIYLVFDAKSNVGVQVVAKAEDDADYRMKYIDGCLRPVGPIWWERTETQLFSVVYTPRRVNDDFKSLKFVWTTTFPGYPDVRHDLSCLRESDVIPGTEVNARHLHPITLHKAFE